MNKTIETLLNHRSIRKFKDTKLTTEQIHTIVKAAQQASTSSHVMAYTIIGITDENLKAELKAVSGQPYVKDNGHLFVFCGDLNRIYKQAAPAEQAQMQESIESTEQFIVTTIDVALAAQNATIAAESMGLGTCFLGSLRNDINHVNNLLDLPEHVIPLFGLAVGYPDQQPEIKPRLPIEAIYHENKYANDEDQSEIITDFDNQLASYYENRSKNARSDTWSEQMIRKYKNPIRMDVTPFIKDKKLNRR
ncbi:FMN reductase (NADPH) [Virgibacillus natechei]|uniref:FMN reductase (NADPH) n=1 Tax=Virgibacillus natechei TaxID=1216297 RepID=A0ABS4IBK5_9BACI|nr:oxygen-insensitive NADPH nitroreductase [Virgibacillus natechei]MBP1968278.1 FMN reductase (NADPH) [Virgibacillus natechei]UZD14456.1 oxygen-insensitive NADPH nitroreductase [Virgibacillus natechei]